MQRNHEPAQRQQRRSLESLSAPEAQLPVAWVKVVSTASTVEPRRAPRADAMRGRGRGGRGKSRAKVPASGKRFVRGSPMSVMGRTWSAGASNGCSNGDMHSAAAAGDVARVEEHLRGGGNVDMRDGRQWSLLHHASFHGRLAVVGALLDAGANKEARTAIQLTPLCLACQNGHQAVAEELLRRGASVAGVVGMDGDCCDEGKEAQQGFNSSGGGRGEGNGNGRIIPTIPPTALFIAAREGHVSLVEFLLAQRGDAVSILRGPEGKFAGDIFGKGVEQEARSRIRTILTEAREKAWKDVHLGRDQQQASGSSDTEHEGMGTGHHSSLALDGSHLAPPLVSSRGNPLSAEAPNGHQGGTISFSPEDSRIPGHVYRIDIIPSQDSRVAGVTLGPRTVSERRSNDSFNQGGHEDEAEDMAGNQNKSGHVHDKARRNGELREGPIGMSDSWGATTLDNVGVGNSGNGVGDVSVSKSGRQGSTGQIERVVITSVGDGGAHVRPTNGHLKRTHISSTPISAPAFGLAIEQPLSASATTPSTNCGNEETCVKGGGVTGRSSLALTSPGLPTPQEWQMCVRQNGLPTPPPLPHDKKPNLPQQMKTLSPTTNTGTGNTAPVDTPPAPRGIGAEAVVLAPVDEVLDGEGLGKPTEDSRSHRSRSACGDHPQVEFGSASPCEQWLKHPLPRSATAPPPAAKSPAHVPLSPAGTVGGGGVVGDGSSSEFEDKWGVTFSNLMDLRTLYRMNSRSANGRGAPWMEWEEEKRALEETISELNMRLASKNHDIAELHMQLEERERDLRLMHGRELEGLDFSELSELEQRIQAALVHVQAKRERIVYKLLKEGGNGAGGDSPNADCVAQS